jgi:hypothetical protein
MKAVIYELLAVLELKVRIEVMVASNVEMEVNLANKLPGVTLDHYEWPSLMPEHKPKVLRPSEHG